jgi:UDP-N-acetylmuramoyl-tripeptide--D-alanyl-D-alanine ligase
MGLVMAAASGRDLSVVGSGETPVDGDCEQDAVVLRTAQGTVRIPLVGRHNLANAALAFHAACRAGVDPAQALAGLASVRAVPGRLRILSLDAHRIIDDAYNANPGSMSAGLAVLAGLPGRRLAVLGGMGELGAASQDLHQRVGAEAAGLGVALIAVGARAEPIAAGYLAAGGRELGRALGVTEALASVREFLSRGPAAVLVKASHSEGLDSLVSGLVAVGAGAGAPC